MPSAETSSPLIDVINMPSCNTACCELIEPLTILPMCAPSKLQPHCSPSCFCMVITVVWALLLFEVAATAFTVGIGGKSSNSSSSDPALPGSKPPAEPCLTLVTADRPPAGTFSYVGWAEGGSGASCAGIPMFSLGAWDVADVAAAAAGLLAPNLARDLASSRLRSASRCLALRFRPANAFSSAWARSFSLMETVPVTLVGAGWVVSVVAVAAPAILPLVAFLAAASARKAANSAASRWRARSSAAASSAAAAAAASARKAANSAASRWRARSSAAASSAATACAWATASARSQAAASAMSAAMILSKDASAVCFLAACPRK